MRKPVISAMLAAIVPLTCLAQGALAKAALKTTLAPPSKPPVLYDFKGVPLEISIEDFRKLSHPDGKASKVVCTGEKIEKFKGYSSEPMDVILFDDTESSLGVKQCVWIDTVGVGDIAFGKGDTAILSLANSGYGSYHYSFSFIKDPKDGVMRLYRYSGTTNVAAYGKIVEGLAGKWGPPGVSKGTVQNKIGNSFDQETAIWSNPLASIVVQTRWNKIDDMNILMEDTRLAKIVSDAKAAKDPAKPNAI